MNSNKPSADDKCHICNSEKREDGMCLCAESWRNPIPTPAPVETGRMNKQQVKDYFDAVDKMEFKMPVAELPKEAEGKAKELVEKFQNKLYGALYSPHNDVSAKQCAIICVDEIINTRLLLQDFQVLVSNCAEVQTLEFWQQVRTAINQL